LHQRVMVDSTLPYCGSSVASSVENRAVTARGMQNQGTTSLNAPGTFFVVADSRSTSIALTSPHSVQMKVCNSGTAQFSALFPQTSSAPRKFRTVARQHPLAVALGGPMPIRRTVQPFGSIVITPIPSGLHPATPGGGSFIGGSPSQRHNPPPT
jgi:hypothetical protein